MAAPTLRQIRQTVGRRVNDLLVLQATAAGDTTSFIDDQNLWLPDRACIDRIAYFTAGTAANLGKKRIVTSNTQANTRISWSLALPAGTAQGDEAELWNARGLGFDPVQQVNATINDVVREALEYVWVEDTEDMGTFDRATPFLAIPTGTRAFYAVEYLDDDDIPHEIPRGKDHNRPGWSYERGTNVVWIRGPWESLANGRTVRMRRYIDDAVLTDDDDTIDLSFDWLVAEVKGILLETAFTKAAGERLLTQRWQKSVNEGNFKRAALGRRIEPDTVVVR